MNLYFYKLNYKNEQEAVKNSASTSISILVGFVGTIIVGASLIGLTFINMYLAIFFTIALLVAGSITMYLVLLKIVERRVLIIEQ